MRRALGILFAGMLYATLLHAAVDGTVVNATTGKPQSNVVVSLVQPGQGGMQTLGSTKTDAEGKFRIDKGGDGAQLVQAIYAGVPYNKMIAPGSPASGIQVEVFEATKDTRTAKVSQHIVFLQPSPEKLSVSEVYFVKNDTKTTLNNPGEGTLRFYVPGHAAQGDAVHVTVNAPGGMPVQRPAGATESPGVYKVGYPLRPGETEFNVAYVLPAAAEFTSKSVQKDIDTRLVVPRGVTLEGQDISPLGNDPSGKATLYSTRGQEYRVKIVGAEAAAALPAETAADEDTGQPQIQQTNPRLYGQLPAVLGLSLLILALGFIVLYRTNRSEKPTEPPAKGKTRR